MSADKRFMAWKRHQRRRKAAKAKVKEYDQGKIKHDQLNSLAQIFTPARCVSSPRHPEPYNGKGGWVSRTALDFIHVPRLIRRGFWPDGISVYLLLAA